MKNMKTQDFDDEVPRTKEETREALHKLLDRIWYHRHLCRKHNLERGIGECDPEVWKGALRDAKTVRSKYPAHELGPWTDFELGVLNGKLSALRWALGDDWDNFDI